MPTLMRTKRGETSPKARKINQLNCAAKPKIPQTRETTYAGEKWNLRKRDNAPIVNNP